MWFTRISIHNPIFACMMMLAVMVMGVFSYQKLQVQQFPNINLPTIVITTDYPNASPKAVEHDVTNKIEDAVNTIGGIDTLTSKSYQGKSIVIVRFDLDTNAATDEENIRENISSISGQFNDNVKTPEIRQVDPDAQPVISLSVTSNKRDLRYLSDLTNNTIVKRLENINGVGEADIVGAQLRQVNINIDPLKLNMYHLSVSDIINVIEFDNQNLPTGTIEKTTTQTNVQIQGEFNHIQDFNHIVVATRNGAPIYLNQVATVQDGQARKDSIALVNGKPAVTIDIIKTDDANTIAVSKAVKSAIKKMSHTLPHDIKVNIVRDNASGISASVSNVKETIFQGALLTILVVFFFLSSWRSTMITALTLPISIIGAFVAVYMFGFTLNNMTLMALSLAIGILIDDAIVVRENISRHILLGKSHYQAALDGTKEIGLAVLATTSSLIAVFLPLAYMQGTIGRMFYEFGITVVVAVLISLLVSYTVDPMLSSLWYDPELEISGQKPWLARFSRFRDQQLARFNRFYRKILCWCLRHRIKTVVLTLAILIASFGFTHFIGKEFIPSADLGEVSIAVTAPEGASLDYTASKVRQIQLMLKEDSDVNYSYAVINSKNAQGDNQAMIFVELKPLAERQHSAQQLIDIFRARLKSFAGLKVMVGLNDAFGRAQRAIRVSVQGQNLTKLSQISDQVEAIMRKLPGFVDIDSSLDVNKPVIYLKINHQLASELGVSTQAIYNVVQPLLASSNISTWLGPDDNDYNVVVQVANQNRRLQSDLNKLYVASSHLNSNGEPIMVALSQLAKFEKNVMPGEIDHRDLNREILISANVQGVSEGVASQKLYQQLSHIKLPAGYRFTRSGNSKKMIESAGYAASALLMAVIFIYIILASQFASFTQPLVIMVSLPLSLIGVFIALFITGSTFNIFSIIGCIMLMGLVTKNAILLIDFINSARSRGVNRLKAILLAGKIRMRPILMTTLAMIFGMLPLALGIGEGAQQRMSMAQAIIGGIITSTILTLVVVPVIYIFIDDLSSLCKKYLLKNYEKTRLLATDNG